jgi:hypothetical protein
MQSTIYVEMPTGVTTDDLYHHLMSAYEVFIEYCIPVSHFSLVYFIGLVENGPLALAT